MTTKRKNIKGRAFKERMFTETRKKRNSKKHYLVHTYRDEDKVKRISQYIGSNLSSQELADAEKEAKKELQERIKKIQPNNPIFLDDGDPWMLGEEIPDCDLFFSSVWCEGFVKNFDKHIGIAYKKILVVYRGMHLWFYFGEDDSNKVGEKILEKFLEMPDFVNTINKNIIIEADKLRKFAEDILIESVHKLSNKDLWEIYKKHQEVHQEYYTWCWIPVAVDMFHNNLTNRLMAYLEGISAGKKYSEYFAILTQPTKRSLIQEEERDLLLIAKKIRNNPQQKKLFKDLLTTFEEQVASKRKLAPHSPEYENELKKRIAKMEKEINNDIKKELYEYYNKYFYVKFMFVGNHGVYTLQDFIKKVVKIIGKEEDIDAQLKEMDEQLVRNKNKADELKKKLNINEKWAKIFDGFSDFMITKIYRRYAQIYALYRMHYVLEEIAKRIQMTKENVQFMLKEEVREALMSNRINMEEIKKRMTLCVFYGEKDYYKMFTGEKAEMLAKKVERKKITGVTELKGQTGCIGYGKGEVKIIMRPNDMAKMNDGDILVSIATDPDIVPAMKKAAAIVTEQGGVTSHAAIVARELNIPCVIGTKIAARVFEDGDIIEVDATNGTVRLIEKGTEEKRKEMQQKVEKEQKGSKDKTRVKREHEERKEKMTERKEHILWFKEVNKNDTPLVGGKGASLGEMHSIMPVPPGFCITVAAYKEVLQKHHDEFLKLLKGRDIESMEELEAVANIIKTKIHAVELPKELEKGIRENYKKIRGKVAIRSSATTEDLDEASFAGQQDTFLNMEGEEAILDAVKKCWASLFNPRAIYYREKNNFQHDQAFLSVVVQKMVAADKAGVLFTVNPINKSHDEMIIEACFGLGEKLVSGEITPDTFIIDKNKETVKEEYLNFDKKTLSEKEMKELIHLAKKIEAHYKKPMDIEWAIEKGKPYILQARPITTLK